jgi:hypothetical protein
MAQFVIKGEHTARGDTESLCARCTHAHIFRGQAPSQERISCEVQWHAPKVITWHVTKCNGFSDRTLPSLAQYEKIAWHISADGPKNKVGFLSPSQYKEKLKQEGGDSEPLFAPWES